MSPCVFSFYLWQEGKKRVGPGEGDGHGHGIGEEPEGLHECDLICEKMLSCGNRRCEERDHRGGCPPCLRSSFEEVRGHVRFIGSGRLCSRWSCERERYMQSESATNKVHSIIVMQRTNLSRYQRRRNHPYFPLQSRPCKVTFLDPLPFVKTLFLLINSKRCLSVAYPLVAGSSCSRYRCLVHVLTCRFGLL